MHCVVYTHIRWLYFKNSNYKGIVHTKSENTVMLVMPKARKDIDDFDKTNIYANQEVISLSWHRL